MPEQPPATVTPGQAAYRDVPAVFSRWCRVDDVSVSDHAILMAWRGATDAQRAFWTADGARLAVVDELRAERDEARKGLADVQHGAGAWVRDAVASATDGITRERDEARAERDDHRGRATEWQKRAARLEADRDHLALELAHAGEERDGLRVLVAEMDAAMGPRPNGISNPQRAGWRQRAGLGEP